jgi:hypothetical protein
MGKDVVETETWGVDVFTGINIMSILPENIDYI